MARMIWELDFYSRPIFDENRKKLWEVLVCESPSTVDRDPASLFRFAKFTDNQHVNSLWLREALEEAIAQAPQPPQKIRFFRRQMNNMISKACEELGIAAAPSRRTYALSSWLTERLETIYPQQSGYDTDAAKAVSVQYPVMNVTPLPDAIRGDKGDRWAFVSLAAADFAELPDWDIGFGEAFPLELAGITSETRVPGFILLSPRAVPLSAWLSGLELGFLRLEQGDRPRLCLETGASDSWILADLASAATRAEATEFEQAQAAAKGVHFLAVQADAESEAFAGFWLLLTPSSS
ncbi:MAG: DUF1092 family protein [Spirulinaceae cyanobacterium SM2_1_0]|nr:DUF1092 family protein [Spirulinaceae cyanobacterium SM2_1_0]